MGLVIFIGSLAGCIPAEGDFSSVCVSTCKILSEMVGGFAERGPFCSRQTR